MTISEISNYLKEKNEVLDKTVLLEIERHLLQSQQEKNEVQANHFWGLRQIYKVQADYISAFTQMKQKKFLDAWTGLEQADIELSILEENFEIGNETDDPYGLIFIRRIIPKFQKCFPKFVFTSRETIIKKQKCSICGKPIRLRGGCNHIPGKLYMGKLCLREITDFEFLALAIVSDPYDKYAVLQIEGQEYDYSVIRFLTERLESPYGYWDFEIEKKVNPVYSHLGRNDKCACGSGKKYKKCCLNTNKIFMDHYKFHIPNAITSVQKEVELIPQTNEYVK